MSADLTQILTSAQLPALPQSAIRLLELSQDPDNGPREFAIVIEADPGLAGQVLKFVNSSYFGFSREISSVKLAITLVGIRTIKNFSLWSAVFSLMPNPKCGPFDLKSLWQDSLHRALFARAFGKVLGLKESEELFAAGLLQDMAVPLLAKALPAEYLRLLHDRNGGKSRLSRLEQERFGWNHGQAAAKMARQWNLPEEFAQLVEHHAELPDLLYSGNVGPGKVSVALSALLPAGTDEAWLEQPVFDACYQQLAAGRGTQAVDLLAQIDAEFLEFAPLLKIAAPGRSLVERFQQAALQPV